MKKTLLFDFQFLRSYSCKLFVFLLLAFVLVIYAITLYHFVALKLVFDFLIFYHAADNYFLGKSIYAQVPWGRYHFPVWLHAAQYIVQRPIPSLGADFSNNLNPPVFTLFMLPFGLVNVSIAVIIWNIILLAGNAWAIKIIYDHFFKIYQKPLIYWVLLGCFLASMPALANLILGQVGILTFLLTIWLWSLAKENKDVQAGVLLGLLLSIKYFLGLIWILFLLQRRWKVVVYAIVSFFILNMIALIVFGFSAYIQYIQVVQRVLWYANNWNASLFGFFSRLDAKVIDLHFVLAAWSQAAYYLCCAVLLIALIKICYKPFKTNADFDYAFSYCLIAALLICPLGWMYYLPLMLLPIALIFQALVNYQKPLTMMPIMAFIFMLGMLSYPSLMQGTIHVGFINLCFSSSCYCYGLLIMLGLLFYTKKYLINGHYSQLAPAQQDLQPWAVLAYLTTIPAASMLFYCDFIRVPRIWQ